MIGLNKRNNEFDIIHNEFHIEPINIVIANKFII